MTKITRAGLDHLYAVRILWQMLVRDKPMVYPELDDESLEEFTFSVAQAMQNPAYPFAVFIAWKGRKAIGFICGEIRWRPIGKPHYYASCHWLYVRPGHRHHGVARDLIAEGIKWIRKQQLPVMNGVESHTEHVEVVELMSSYDDTSWKDRGFIPYSTYYMLPLTEVALKGTKSLKARPVETEQEVRQDGIG